MARAVGVTREAISQWESSGIKDLKPDNLLAVADYFGVSIRWLVTGRDSKGPPLAKAAVGDARKSGPALSPPALTSVSNRGGALPPLAEPDLDPNVLALARTIESLPTEKKGHLSAVVDAFTKSLAGEVWDGRVERRKKR
ncbi:MAG: helix-turn-helix domain-containing protein [Pseudomonadota bacterium]|nr:helix-turn-helix domain-containing protein [Pseudomonadota bacterium]